MLSLPIWSILIFLMTLLPSLGWGQDVPFEISSSPNPVGSGARAIGMGGAFIGVADDATATSWNPGGLIQLENPEVSIVGAYNRRREDTTYESFPEASGPQSVSTYELNYFSLAYPFSIYNKNMIVSLNFQHLYDFNKKLNYGFTFADPGPPPLTLQSTVKYDQEGALRAISPAYAIQILPQLSFGFTVNFWDDSLCHWENKFLIEGSGSIGPFAFIEKTEQDQRWDFRGVNFNLGFLWNINSVFTLGGVFKSPFRARLEHEFHRTRVRSFPALGIVERDLVNSTDKQKLDMPMSYGLGMAARLSDALTLDLDVYRTEWDDFIRYTSDGRQINPVTGDPAGVSKSEPTTQIRLGGEYLFIGNRWVIPLRAGVFYDPEPSENNPENFFGFSLGSGIAYKKLIYDIAYQYRFARDASTTSFTIGGEIPSQDIDQHSIYMSIIYHF